MNKLASNPIVILALGLVLGLATGLGWFMKAARPLIAQAREQRVKVTKSGKPDAPWDFWTIDIENLASELKDEKEALKKHEEVLGAREARMATERQELEKQRGELEALRSDIGSRMTEIQADELKNLKSLAAMYANLSPTATLAIFKQMEDPTVVKLLSIMKPDAVGLLFEEMGRQAGSDPTLTKRAASLSEKLRLVKSAKTAANP